MSETPSAALVLKILAGSYFTQNHDQTFANRYDAVKSFGIAISLLEGLSKVAYHACIAGDAT